MDWNRGKYCNVFISCLDCHFDGTHSLQRMHWWASDVMVNFSKYFPIKKQLVYILDSLRIFKFSFLGELCFFFYIYIVLYTAALVRALFMLFFFFFYSSTISDCCDLNNQANFREAGCGFPEDRCQYRWNGVNSLCFNCTAESKALWQNKPCV